MAAIRKAFDFTDFDQAPAPAPEESQAEPTFTQADLDAAVEAARADALEQAQAEATARESGKLVDLTTEICASLDADADRLAAHIEATCEIAREITEGFCLNAAALQMHEHAMALLERFLKADQARPEATLMISSKTPAPIAEALREAVTERCERVSLETDDALAPGAIALDWRGGALSTDGQTIASQLQTIFDGVAASGAAPSTKQETPS